MSYVYCGVRGPRGVTVTRNGQPFDHAPSCKVWNHSPTGFEWGYGGSGPAQLALAILLDYCSDDEASALHQLFKWAVVADLDAHHWTMFGLDVERWVQVQRDKADVNTFLSTPEERP